MSLVQFRANPTIQFEKLFAKEGGVCGWNKPKKAPEPLKIKLAGRRGESLFGRYRKRKSESPVFNQERNSVISSIANGGMNASRVRCSRKLAQWKAKAVFQGRRESNGFTQGLWEQNSMKRKKLLLVDDESLVLHSFSRELASESLEVIQAENGEQAISCIKNGHFDVVVTDLVMPELDGFQVLKVAKKTDVETIVIILTGHGDMESAVDALRLGADDFLQKPCDPNELLYRISNCLVKQDLQKRIAVYEKCLPVCSYCRKIRDDRQGEHGTGPWYTLEEYFNKTSGGYVSHGCCPDCFAEQVRGVHLGQNE